MPEKFTVVTVLKSVSPVLADYYETTISEPTGVVVTCAGDTPTDSEANARAYLAMLLARKGPHQEKK